MKKKTYAVFGLGRYGRAVAKELVDNGMEVLAVDKDQNIVNDAAAYLPIQKCADVTDLEVLKQLGLGEGDTVIICMASDFEATVMAASLCKELGVEKVIVKCGSKFQQKILYRIGVDNVVFPENESGIRLAKSLLSASFIDIISISKDVSMIEVDVKEEWVGKSLIELNLRKKYGFNIVAIKQGEAVNVKINPEQALESGTTLIVIADTAKLGKLK